MPKPVSALAIQLAQDFAAAFPYPENQNEVVIPNIDFDAWAHGKRHYNSVTDQKATISMNRNSLRNKINHAASHPEYLRQGHVPFHVAVHQSGVSVIVSPPKDAFDLKVDKAPSLVTAKAAARKRDLETLKNIVVADKKSPPEALLKVTYAIKEIDKYVRVIEFQQVETDNAIKSAYEEIKKLAQSGALGAGASKLLMNGNGNGAEDAEIINDNDDGPDAA